MKETEKIIIDSQISAESYSVTSSVRPQKPIRFDVVPDCCVELSGISLHYANRSILENIKLLVHSGEVICLLGPSGCGKTTILRIVAGFVRPDTGSVRFGNQMMTSASLSLSPEKRGIGFLFQDYALFPHMTVTENIAFGLRKMSKQERSKIIDEALEMVCLRDRASCYPHMLSGGQQQRVALVRAIAPKPRALLLDEPFSGLDARLRDEIRDRTLHLIQKNRTTTLMVTHDPREAMYMADRISIMGEGKIVQTGTPDTLYRKPNSAYTASFMGEVNRFHAPVEKGVAKTPFGDFKSNISTPYAEIIIRPEALKLSSGDDQKGCKAFVMASRLIGGFSLVHMRCKGFEKEIHLHARIFGHCLPKIGEVFYVTVDSKQLFVFESKKQKA